MSLDDKQPESVRNREQAGERDQDRPETTQPSEGMGTEEPKPPRPHQRQLGETRDSFMRRMVDLDFTYHTPSPVQIPKYEFLRERGRILGHLILDECPDTREREKALEKLSEAIMWANAGIARKG